MDLSSQLALFIAPLVTALSSEEEITELLQELNIISSQTQVSVIPEPINNIVLEATDAINTFATLAEGEGGPAERVVQAIDASRAVIELIVALDAAINDLSPDALLYPFNEPETWTKLAEALPAYLLARWMRGQFPITYSVLQLTGAVQDNGNGGIRIDFDALQSIFADPVSALRTITTENPDLLWEALHRIVATLGLHRPTRVLRFEDGVIVAEYPSRRLPTPPGFQMGMSSETAGANWSLGVDIEPPPGSEPGIQVLAYLSGSLELNAPLVTPWILSVSIGSEGTVGLLLTPDGVTTSQDATVHDATFALEGTPEVPWALIGNPGSSRLELAGFRFGIEVSELLQDPEMRVSLDTDGLRLVITPGDGDSFLADVLGGEFSADSSMAMVWSTESGFTFGGSIGFEITIPLNLSLGPISFETLTIGIHAGQDGLEAELGAVIQLAIGPLAAVVDGIGLVGGAYPAETSNGGAFGDLDFRVAFKPPNGIGIAIDVGPVKGGGYLYIDNEKGEYAGILDIKILEVGITAIALIATKIPEIQGWSMFFSLFAQFTGIQLGMGFTLNGVGGLVGINRGMDEDALADGVRSGALDSILFPDDPIANAPRILSDIATIFPPAEGQYVFGPVVKLGWGTPSLVVAELGIILQLPDPLTITLLGSLEIILPTDEAPIVELRVDVAGTINFTEATLKVDASLRDSSVAGLSLTGDLAIRASFRDSPSFLFSFGGFHPAFTPPEGFPSLARLAIGLDTGDNLRITLGGYFAVSSSTLQFGAFCEIWASAAGFTAEGGTTFDAMIIFKPFGFMISLKIWVSISAGNSELLAILLAGDLKGPNPWHVKGLAEFKLLGIKKKLEVEVSFGNAEEEEPTEEIVVETLLLDALRDPDAWSVIEGELSSVVISAEEGDQLRVHPAGAIEVRQRIAPLGLQLEHYGNAAVSGANEFELSEFTINETPVQSTDVEDWFAASQYIKMSDAERLSAPSFELMPAGVRLEGSSMTGKDARPFSPDYEVKIKDPSVGQAKKKTSKKGAKSVDKKGGENTSKKGVMKAARALTFQSRAKGKKAGPTTKKKRGPTLKEVSYTTRNIRTGKAKSKGVKEGRYFAVRKDIALSAKPGAFAATPAYELEDINE